MKTKKGLSFVLILLYGVALLKPAFPLMEYAFKMDVYLSQCTNKARPELHCNGQCVLMQKLKAMDVESSTPGPPAPVKVNLQDYPIGFIELIKIPALHSGFLEKCPVDSAGTPEHCFASDIFHPPATCS